MNPANRIRISGQICIAAAVLWVAAITIEYRYGLKPPGTGALYTINQGMFIAAILGYLIGILGLVWSRAAGTGRFAKISLGLFGGGYFLILVATSWSTLTGNNENPLFPIGGLAASLGSILAGIAVASAGLAAVEYIDLYAILLERAFPPTRDRKSRAVPNAGNVLGVRLDADRLCNLHE